MKIQMEEPQAKQLQALQSLSEYPVLFYGGAKGGGKSWLVRAWQVMRRVKYPGTVGVIIRKTYPELMGNHIEKMWIEYPGLRKYYNESQKLIRFPNGSKLYFRHLANTSDVYNYQGTEYEDIALDECTQHSEEVFSILRSSNRTVNPDIKPKFLLTGNPGGPGHIWVKRLFIDKEYYENENPEEYGFVQAKVWDNDKLLGNDPAYLMRLQGLPEDKRRAYLDGDWDVFEGQFFSEWRADKHVIEPRYKLADAPSSFTYRLGWDEGMRAPRSVHLLAQDNDGKVEVIWEYYQTEETASTAAWNIKTKLNEAGILTLLRSQGRLIHDPSMNISSNQSGISTSRVVSDILGIPMEAGNNNRVEGARKFKDYIHWTELNPPLIQVWSTCRNLIRTLPQLIYDERNGEDLDTDGEDHCYDSTRYGLMAFRKSPERFKGDTRQTGIQKYSKPRNIWAR